MDLSYFQKINNTFQSKSKQETDLYLLNRHVEDCFDDSIDYKRVKRNGEDFELIIIKDTDGNTQKKKIKSRPSQPFNLGDYIKWNEQIWLITLLDPDDKTYSSGYMYLCTLPLRWQLPTGEIVERWGYSEDFTKYSNGTTGNDKITVGDNQYGITLPIDEETKQLKRDMRFAVDFEDAIEPDIYKLTNRKIKLNNNTYFGRGGTIIFTLSFNSFNKGTDKHITLPDGNQVWICDYHSPTDVPTPTPDPGGEIPVLSASISGGNTLRYGRAKTWTVAFKDKDGNEVTNCDFKWNIVSDFEIAQTVNTNEIQLRVDNEDCIGSSFLLQITNNNRILTECQITIIGEF